VSLDLFGGLLFGAYGLFAAIRPRSAWNLHMALNSWQYKKVPEPSEHAILWTRVLGFVFLLIGVVLVAQALSPPPAAIVRRS
jgi:hypothetical protein